MDDQHAAAETNRQYGELYYRADAVAAILRVVADMVEADQRDALLYLSHAIPSTMRWDDHGGDLQQSPLQDALYRPIQLRLEYGSILGIDPMRLDALLRRGPSPVRSPDGEHAAGVADEQPHAK